MPSSNVCWGIEIGAGAIKGIKLEDGDGSVLIDEFVDLGIAVLVVTGYGGFAHARVPVLYKPFATSALLQSINSLLGGRQ